MAPTAAASEIYIYIYKRYILFSFNIPKFYAARTAASEIYIRYKLMHLAMIQRTYIPIWGLKLQIEI